MALLQEHGVEPTVVEYLKDSLTTTALSEIITYLGINPIELVRTKEVIWKEQFKGMTLSDAEIVQAMIDYPKLMERPIVVKQKKAVLGRPPQNVLGLL